VYAPGALPPAQKAFQADHNPGQGQLFRKRYCKSYDPGARKAPGIKFRTGAKG
jgi:hypothetical protein